MSLQNLHIKSNSLSEKINKLKKDKADLDKRYQQVNSKFYIRKIRLIIKFKGEKIS